MPNFSPVYPDSLQKIVIYFVLDGSNIALAYYELTNLIHCSFYDPQKILTYSSYEECLKSKIFLLQVTTAHIVPELITINRFVGYTLSIGVILGTYQVDFTISSDQNFSSLLRELEKDRFIINHWLKDSDSFKITLLTIGDFVKESFFSKETYYHWIPSLGKTLSTITKASIDLEEYIHHIEFIVHSRGAIILGFQLFQVNRKSILKRSPKHREFFHPASMNPLLIRGMINLGLTPMLIQQLSYSPNDCTFLDPFMGGGGFILDALDIGFSTFGIDLNHLMSRGAHTNIKNFETRFAFKPLPWTLFYADSKYIPLKSNILDLIVADPPYGTNSSLMNMSLGDLLAEVLVECFRTLKSHSRLVLCTPATYSLFPHFSNHRIIATIKVPVHRSLTRMIWVIEKIA